MRRHVHNVSARCNPHLACCVISPFLPWLQSGALGALGELGDLGDWLNLGRLSLNDRPDRAASATKQDSPVGGGLWGADGLLGRCLTYRLQLDHTARQGEG